MTSRAHIEKFVFVRHPEYWVQGVVAPMFIINGGNLNWHDNRPEGISLTKGVLGELHLLSCQNPSVKDNTLHKIIFTAGTRSRPRTKELIKFYQDNHYGDVTSKRNYNCGSQMDFAEQNDSISLANNYNLLNLLVADRTGMNVAAYLSVDMVGFEIKSYSVSQGIYAKLIDAQSTPTIIPSSTSRVCMGLQLHCNSPAKIAMQFSSSAIGEYGVPSWLLVRVLTIIQSCRCSARCACEREITMVLLRRGGILGMSA